MKSTIPTLPKFRRHSAAVMVAALFLTCSPGLQNLAFAEEVAKPDAETADPLVEMTGKRDQLKLPGLTVMVKERYVDVDSRVCLSGGMLELIACTKDSKEHESIIAVDAKAAHIHVALLLLNARAGNPAMRKPIEGEEGGWVDFPPRGSKIDVSLVIEGEDGKPVERPIRDFIVRNDDNFSNPSDTDMTKRARFPTDTFLFAGSHVFKDGKSEPRYIADESGNVISVVTFGDELLCLPGVHGHSNEGLVWEVDPTHLPKLGTNVKLRLRPHGPDAAKPEDKTTE